MPDHALTERQQELLEELRDGGSRTVSHLCADLGGERYGWTTSMVRSTLKQLEGMGEVTSDNYQLPARVWMVEG